MSNSFKLKLLQPLIPIIRYYGLSVQIMVLVFGFTIYYFIYWHLNSYFFLLITMLFIIYFYLQYKIFTFMLAFVGLGISDLPDLVNPDYEQKG